MDLLSELKIQIFADGANKKGIIDLSKQKYISGFTTNPSLMKNSGIKNYEEFCLDILQSVTDKPISFEVFSDDFNEMYEQALKISQWGENVNVKIPISNTKGESSKDLISSLTKEGVKLNITAIFTLDQIEEAANSSKESAYTILSLFAGRIADTGRDPEKICKEATKVKNSINPDAKLLWASPREIYNIFQAERSGCEIITVAHNILSKIGNLNKDLSTFSIETIKMFYDDATNSGYKI